MDCPPWKDDFIFQSTPSVWRETVKPLLLTFTGVFQSTPSVWRETSQHATYKRQSEISIHSLRVEGDSTGFLWKYIAGISIHSLRVEGDT